jgi:hypothetical protein
MYGGGIVWTRGAVTTDRPKTSTGVRNVQATFAQDGHLAAPNRGDVHSRIEP